ncbi:Hypothetical predicted protein [Paramuricea clavata]|uniref:Uncharacterized protein n=1 Tax=Paramuricea clavata TaxID=317549 RepID=A0A7D9IJR3_PARCT|nr:Hypothetical predicted protein [Paramuricea clavata]
MKPKSITDEDQSYTKSTIGRDNREKEVDVVNVLGAKWDCKTASFSSPIRVVFQGKNQRVNVIVNREDASATSSKTLVYRIGHTRYTRTSETHMLAAIREVFWILRGRAAVKNSHREEFISSRDGKIRAAIVRTINGQGKPSRFRRVIQHLIPLEIRSNSQEYREDLPVGQNTRVRRDAAIVGELRRIEQSEN